MSHITKSRAKVRNVIEILTLKFAEFLCIFWHFRLMNKTDTICVCIYCRYQQSQTCNNTTKFKKETFQSRYLLSK